MKKVAEFMILDDKWGRVSMSDQIPQRYLHRDDWPVLREKLLASGYDITIDESLSIMPPWVSGVTRICYERNRHIEIECFTAERDDKLVHGELVRAALTYLVWYLINSVEWMHGPWVQLGELWPWDLKRWKPKDGISNLVRSGALIAAEIDRRQRAARSIVIP